MTATQASALRVLVTGATGMLGRSLCQQLVGPEFELMGTALRRADGKVIMRVDLTSEAEVVAVMDTFKPDVVINCAAERDPDTAAKDEARTRMLNVDSPKMLAMLCAQRGSALIQLSTDYVFDGGVFTKSFPPYDVDAPTHPLNLYAVTKRDSETVVLACKGARALVLRVPVLYAVDCATVSESASLSVAKSLLSKEVSKVDNWGVRFPTLVDDVASVIVDLVRLKGRGPGRAPGTHDPATGILHCSSPYHVSKYELVKLMGRILDVNTEHLLPDDEAPKGEPRPKMTQLNCDRTWSVIGRTQKFTSLEDGMRRALRKFGEEIKRAPGAADAKL
eukprot:CAMPEP_0206039264 /NCGR_PEP_ID=MMETSP1466-20131121/4638_1 /ASSEMBLY_ACC=CAM_ASM_001126 /TAXON_ID=44452 /ORGANISM="Pavlova gyrans, Strain CCMP608" /LENGTH=333 /DNA_ID=CAMNT_0053413897 /DNA_START=48 /DNA_END=1049 /DNA_ORIENTATION=+